ncbi:MAG: L-aspartate oxidase, partial [Actinomycetes bacterium]
PALDASEAGTVPHPIGRSTAQPEPFSRGALQRLMTAKASVLRSGALLQEAAQTLDLWAAVVRPHAVPAATAHPMVHEDRNLLLAAQLLVAAALNRAESLGAHYRSDEPEETFALRPKASLLHD